MAALQVAGAQLLGERSLRGVEAPGPGSGRRSWDPAESPEELRRRKELGEIGDRAPAIAQLDRIHLDVGAIFIQHGLALLSEGWDAVILFLPDGLSVGPAAGAPQAQGERTPEGARRPQASRSLPQFTWPFRDDQLIVTLGQV